MKSCILPLCALIAGISLGLVGNDMADAQTNRPLQASKTTQVFLAQECCTRGQ